MRSVDLIEQDGKFKLIVDGIEVDAVFDTRGLAIGAVKEIRESRLRRRIRRKRRSRR